MDDPGKLLAQIHNQEKLLAERITNAQAQAKSSIADAERMVAAEIEQALQKGKQAGTAEFQDALSQIDQEAATIRHQAQNKAEQLHHSADVRMETAVAQAIRFIIGQVNF